MLPVCTVRLPLRDLSHREYIFRLVLLDNDSGSAGLGPPTDYGGAQPHPTNLYVWFGLRYIDSIPACGIKFFCVLI